MCLSDSSAPVTLLEASPDSWDDTARRARGGEKQTALLFH